MTMGATLGWSIMTALGFLVMTGLVVALATSSTARYEFERNGDGGTRFSYMNQYGLPGGIAGRIAGRAIVKASGGEADRSLERLKKLVESKQ